MFKHVNSETFYIILDVLIEVRGVFCYLYVLCMFRLRLNDCVANSFSHDGFDGAPLEIFSCYAAGEDNQRFNFDPESGTLTTLQGGPTTAPFVMTACGIDE